MNQFIKTKNYSEREGQQIRAVVCHITDGTKNSVIQHFTNPNSKVSAHYLVAKGGDIIQFSEEQFATWHAGIKYNSTAKLVLENPTINFNKISVGVEFECFSNQDLTEIQYVNGGKLIGEIGRRHSLQLNRDRILRHNEIRKSKSCPGIVSVEKLIRYAHTPPQLSEIESIKIKISLLQKIMALLKSLASYKKLGSASDDERGE